MVDYAKMTDAEIEKYREKSRKEAEKIQEEWKTYKEFPDMYKLKSDLDAVGVKCIWKTT